MGHNVNPRHIEKPYISLDNKVEAQFFFAIEVLDQKRCLTNQSLLKFMAQIL